ncbi:MAG: sugar ABC transporter substrate-binding protein [Eubacteriales bacterium]|nr:sugar ABC transporter substrate-binding protein [Eubacteriales bacterium]
MKKGFIRTLIVALILCLVVALPAGCAQDEDTMDQAAETDVTVTETMEETTATDENYNFAVQVINMEQTFYKLLLTGIEDGLAEGDTMTVYSIDFSSEEQLNQMESIVLQDYVAIIMQAMDDAVATKAAKLANEAGIPIMCVDISIDDTSLLFAERPGNDYNFSYACGVAMAEGLMEKNGSYEGKIITYCPLSEAAIAIRYEAFVDAISQYDGIEIVYNIEEDATVDVAVSAFESVLAAHPEANGFWAFCDPPTIAAMQVLEEQGNDSFVITTVEATTEIVDAIKEGKCYAGVDTNPYTSGQNAIEVCYQCLNGEEFEFSVETPQMTVTADTLEDGVTWQIEEEVVENFDIDVD